MHTLPPPHAAAAGKELPLDGRQPLPRAPRLLDRLADALRTRGYVALGRHAYVDWLRRYIHFHQLRHPQDLGAPEVAAFLASRADNPDGPDAAEDEARAALAFL